MERDAIPETNSAVVFSVPIGCARLTRRTMLTTTLGGALFSSSIANRSAAAVPWLPAEVAGIVLPASSLALKAVAFARNAQPAFLFNHCMRSYLFGAIYASRHGIHFDSEAAVIAAAFHDLGLLPRFASRERAFEVDGADTAESFLRRERAPDGEDGAVWNAIALHATRPQFTAHQTGEVLLLSAGVGVDFAGPDPSDLDPKQEQEILAAFPRLGFKKEFLSLLTDHCRRKPLSQRATWLGDFCRAQVPGTAYPDVVRALMTAPFPE